VSEPLLPAIQNDLAPEPMTLRQQLLAHLSLRPYDTPQLIAKALGVSPYTVQILQGSDEFKLALSERYTVGQVRAKTRAAEVALSAFNALERMMQETTDIPYAVRLEAARVTLAHVEKLNTPQAAASGPALSVNVSITQEDLSRARERALTHARGITIDLPTLAETPLPAPVSVLPEILTAEQLLSETLPDVLYMGQTGRSSRGDSL